MHRVLTPLALALALLIVPAAAAQDGSLPDAQDNTLWVHIQSSPRTYWINALADDPRHDSAGAGYNALGFALTEPGVAAWTLAMDPPLAGPVPFLDGGNVDFTLYVGGGGGAGRVSVTAELLVGTTSVAKASWPAFNYANAYTELKQSVAPAVQALDPSVGELKLVLRASGAGAQILIGAGGATWSKVVLPIAPGAPSGTFREHNLTGAAAEFNLAPATPANATHLYRWSTNLTALDLSLVGNRSAGNASIQVADGANATLFDGVFDGNATHKALQGVAGNWTIRVELNAFAGNLTARLGAPPAPGSTGSTSGSSTAKPGTKPTSTDGPAGNATGNGTEDGGKKDSPALPVPLVAAGLAAAALVAVRRRRP